MYKICGNYRLNDFENLLCKNCLKSYESCKKFVSMGYDDACLKEFDVNNLKDNFISSSNPLD
jgi:hypothetical protein